MAFRLPKPKLNTKLSTLRISLEQQAFFARAIAASNAATKTEWYRTALFNATIRLERAEQFELAPADYGKLEGMIPNILLSKHDFKQFRRGFKLSGLAHESEFMRAAYWTEANQTLK